MTAEDGFELATRRLVLRRFNQSDTRGFYAYRSDPAACKFQSWKPRTVEEIEKFISQQSLIRPNEAGTWFQLAICRRDDGALVGDCGIHFIEEDGAQAEIGFTIAPPFQGNGYATEAFRAILDYLFRILHKHRVYGSVDPRNVPSLALLRRVGLREEAHFRKSIRSENGWDDALIFAILDEEWRQETE